jgi:hypothetical protein
MLFSSTTGKNSFFGGYSSSFPASPAASPSSFFGKATLAKENGWEAPNKKPNDPPVNVEKRLVAGAAGFSGLAIFVSLAAF